MLYANKHTLHNGNENHTHIDQKATQTKKIEEEK